jgi:leucyl aminopeptidase
MKTTGFKPTPGKAEIIGFTQQKAPHHVMLLGMGKKSALTPERMAAAGGSASRALKNRGFKSCHLLLDESITTGEGSDYLYLLFKGFALAHYSFSLKSGRTSASGLRRVTVMSEDSRTVNAAIKKGKTIAAYAGLVRDLVNRPADDVTPETMAEEAKILADDHGIECRVLTLKQIEKLKMGAVLAVARGSRREPRFISLHYNKGAAARDDVPKVCLVGKGVTFDSGGISIKPWQNMNEMKGDMAGAAVVMSTIGAAAKFSLPIEIIGVMPCVENMPDGIAIKPGDVITTYSGKTIEIISTDAEGRLILSDALAFANEHKPDVIIDLATLTGAVIIALGTRIAGTMGNSQEEINRLITAGRSTGEPVWQLPLDDAFKKAIKGDISDYKNFSGRDGSTITAAALLGEFVGKTPWVHVDIAGTFWAQSPKVPYQSKGATGFGVDLMIAYLESLISKNSV